MLNNRVSSNIVHIYRTVYDASSLVAVVDVHTIHIYHSQKGAGIVGCPINTNYILSPALGPFVDPTLLPCNQSSLSPV